MISERSKLKLAIMKSYETYYEAFDRAIEEALKLIK